MQWHTPIGYKVVNGKIEVCEEHRKLVVQIFTDYDNGRSALKIAQTLKKNGVKNAHDRVGWSHASIGRILENYNYLGTEYYPQIIDKKLFDRVQKKREQVRIEKSRGDYRPNKKERLLFSGMLVCAECGAVYSHTQPHVKRKNAIPKWKCKNYVYQNQVSCRGGDISDRQVEQVCISAINMLLRQPGRLAQVQIREQCVSAECRKVDRRLEESTELTTEEKMALIYERARARYQTLEVRDEEIQTEEMRRLLAGKEELEEFDETLYRGLIAQIVVYKDNNVRVIFKNHDSIKIGYGDM